ncbi:hypothetical protein HZS_6708 [Henneguya salminicola]|nr:hypothetical protein HZS_6708 [Henneguya salminicola]
MYSFSLICLKMQLKNINSFLPIKTYSSWAKCQKYEDIEIDEEDSTASHFSRYKAILIKTNESVSLWQWKNDGNYQNKQILLNSIQTLKKIRHPNILLYMDEELNESEIVLITEHVTSLELYLKNISKFEQEIQYYFISLGILNIFVFVIK